MTTPSIHVVCENEQCSWFGLLRKVYFRPIGSGMYERPAGVVCECRDDRDLRMTAPPDLSAELFTVPADKIVPVDDASVLYPTTQLGEVSEPCS